MKNTVAYLLTLLVFISFSLISCEKEITVDLPTTPAKIVVEGSIEQGQPPIILLSWSQGYFEPTNLASLSDMYIRDAEVIVSNGTDTVTLDLVCTDDLTPEQLEQAAELIGISPDVLTNLQLCLYTSFNPVIWGEQNKEYKLWVNRGEHRLTSTTKINNLVYLDSLWFFIPNEDPGDSLGFIGGFITDPDTAGNAFRWYAKRINKYSSNYEEVDLRGQQKDGGFIAPIGSVFDDEFFNGLNFEFAYYRGTSPNSTKLDDTNEERGYFKRGDTVVVRGCVIDRGAFNFISSLEDQIANQGSPFALPYNLQSNISGGGLGAWIGYGAVYDTVICQ
ncbi:MAG: hypothetical protein RLZZ77_1698 [Bacteroidota bacterium]|jgi:hypothetical protein